ncbi:MAG TPA: LysE/ArgO family amino acid transporter [Pseudonocardiaceae bacterium]|nr:LysE/ArgO family amino acid transporter [Pseudonocardiaceae bacterium]
MLGAVLAGLGTGLSLIVVIGAQNAFVLRQGILRAYVPAIVLICALSDLVLIVAGVAGIGVVVRAFPLAIELVSIIGGLFLIGYGLMAARRVLRPARLATDNGGVGSLRAAVLTGIALTWLNPHVYLDTVLLLGSVANSYGADRWAFGAGAALGSVLWFSGLGFGARLLRGLFARPIAWRVLDVLIAAIMITLGVVLFTRLAG